MSIAETIGTDSRRSPKVTELWRIAQVAYVSPMLDDKTGDGGHDTHVQQNIFVTRREDVFEASLRDGAHPGAHQ